MNINAVNSLLGVGRGHFDKKIYVFINQGHPQPTKSLKNKTTNNLIIEELI